MFNNIKVPKGVNLLKSVEYKISQGRMRAKIHITYQLSNEKYTVSIDFFDENYEYYTTVLVIGASAETEEEALQFGVDTAVEYFEKIKDGKEARTPDPKNEKRWT